MKKLIITIASIALVAGLNFGAKAQDVEENDERIIHTKKSSIFNRRDFGLYLGLNNYTNTQNLPELNNLQSRFVALQWRKNHRLITGGQVDLAMATGWELGWNNLMFNDNIRVARLQDGTTDFVDAGRTLDKSKLTTFNFNVPLMLQIGFKESNWRLGVGAYGGVRLDSYTKTKDSENGTKRNHGAYNLNKFHYGLAAEMGRSDFAIFARYEMTPMFRDGNGVNGNMVSFGVRL